MLTIDEIKNISFRKATLSGGYRAEDVDAFIDEVIASFEQLKKEKTNLVHKIDRLATRLEEYRSDEETVRNALLTSQKMSDACIREAKEKAARILRDAEEKSRRLLEDAEKATALEKENYLQLQGDAVNLRAELIELYRTHIKTIDDLPTAADLEKSRQTLDEKYPTEDAEPTSYPMQDFAGEEVHQESYAEESYDEPAPEPSVQQLRQVPRRQQPRPARQQSQPKQPAMTDANDGTKVAPKRQSKFAHLKFGDNYDVSAD